MSHFGVLVIGGDVEKQLAPYHEFECTGVNDEFVQDVDVTDECKEHGLDYHGLEDATVTSEDQVDRDGEHKFGYAIVAADGALIKAVNRTNPNKKWDWYQIGGRWSGFLKIKAGAAGVVGEPGLLGSHIAKGADRADITRKGDIDFAGMRDDAGAAAAANWDKAAAAHGGETWMNWEAARAKHPESIESARTEYNDQPAIKALREAFKDRFFFEPDQFLVTREQFVQEARDEAVVTYAVVKDGGWISKGEMGWFGMSDDVETQADWNRKINAMLDELPDDTPITVVDCHI